MDPNKNIFVAFSGGGDSSALLHFCHELNQQKLLNRNLCAIHINHSLNKDSDKIRNFEEVIENQIGDDPKNWASDEINEVDLKPYIYPETQTQVLA